MAAGARVLDSLYISGFGTAAASGTVSFYQPGTLVPVTVYSDDTLSTVLTQPITLDASGKTALPVYTATPLRAIIKSVAGATLQDVARIDGDRAELVGVSNAAWTATDLNSILTAIQTSTGGIDGKFIDSGASAVARTIQAKFAEVQVSVKDFGAVGNGIADDTTAIQGAINRVIALGGGTVFVPSGTYLTSLALSVTGGTCTIAGTGSEVTTIRLTNATANLFSIAATGGLRLQGLSLRHSSSTTGAAISSAAGASLPLALTYVVVGNGSEFAKGIDKPSGGGAGSTMVIDRSTVIASGMSVSITPLTKLYIDASVITGVTGGILQSFDDVTLTNSIVTSTGGYPVDVGGNGGNIALITGNYIVAVATEGIRLSSAVGSAVYWPNRNQNGVLDGNVSAFTNYSLSSGTAVAPQPGIVTAIRIVATAAITVTISAVAKLGFGRQFTLICSNASGGAVVWSFAAQYVLSAAVAPATGNRVNLLLEYNPIDSKCYEIGRASTAN